VLAESSPEVKDERYNATQIRALYASERYPLQENLVLRVASGYVRSIAGRPHDRFNSDGTCDAPKPIN
jgi:hypothetical protein